MTYLAGRARAPDREPPSLVILDLNLPVTSGIDVLRGMRASSEWKDLPVLVYSSSASNVDIEVCTSLGAFSYVVKPGRWGEYIELGNRLRAYFPANAGSPREASGIVRSAAAASA